MRPLQGAIRHYAWGSPTALCDLLGMEPCAELWLGAHRSAPAHVDGTALDALIAADPRTELGADVACRYGGLPFLFKVLSAAEPLSLQVHPSKEQAEAGYAAENALGIPVDSPQRTFRDRNRKPELICALTEFIALSGFEDPAVTLGLLDLLHDAAPSPALDQMSGMLRRAPSADGLREVLAWLLRTDDPSGLVAAVTRACEAAAERSGPAGEQQTTSQADEQTGPHLLCREVAALGSRYPDDPAVAAALLLNLVRLQPGDALYLETGTLHSYLRGTALEVMASSDNVVRAGLTAKHVDIETLLEIADTTPCEPFVQRPDLAAGSEADAGPELAAASEAQAIPDGGEGPDVRAGPVIRTGADAAAGVTSYRVPAHEFSLERIETEHCDVAVSGPAVLFCTAGTATVAACKPGGAATVTIPRHSDGSTTALRARAGDSRPSAQAPAMTLTRGQAAWLSASDNPVRLSGQATVFRAGAGSF